MTEWKNIKEHGLPPVGIPLIVTIHSTFTNSRELRYPVIYRKSFFKQNYGFYEYGLEESWLIPECSEVLAWTEVPEIYGGR